MYPTNPKEVMEIITRECRDLLDLIVDREVDMTATDPEKRNQLIRDHFNMDLSGYGIPVEEYVEGLTTEDRIEVVDRVLAEPQYTS